MSSIAVTTFFGRFIDGGCVPKHVPGLPIPNTEVGPGVINWSSEISSNV